MSITTSTNGVKTVAFSEILNLIPEMESNQMFILMKNCTKIGLRLNKQMVGAASKMLQSSGMRYEYLDVTWIGMLLLGFRSKFLKKV